MKTTSDGTDEIYRTFEGTDGDAFGITYTGFWTSGSRVGINYPINYVFSPAYAGSVTVIIEGTPYSTTNTIEFNKDGFQNSSLILMEIAG